MKTYISTIGLCLLLIGVSTIANGQNLNLKKGDQYKITTVMSTSTSMKRGDKIIDIKSMSKITKSVGVAEATGNGYNLNMTVTNIADTIDAFNQKLAYNTNRAADPASTIETELYNMVGGTQTLNLDKTGKITQIGNMSKAASDAETAANAGVYFDNLTIGNTLKLGANFKLPAGYAKGTTWKDNTKVGELTKNTTYKVEETTADFTKVSFTTEQKDIGLNININGALVMDNNTGVVVQRILKTDSKSNESVEGKTFITATKIILSEVAEKVK